MNRTLKRGKKMAEEMTGISINEEAPTDTKKKKNKKIVIEYEEK